MGEVSVDWTTPLSIQMISWSNISNMYRKVTSTLWRSVSERLTSSGGLTYSVHRTYVSVIISLFCCGDSPTGRGKVY